MRKILARLPVFFFLFALAANGREPMRVLNHPQTGRPVQYSGLPNDLRQVMLPLRYSAKRWEFRGIWVATYANMDFPRTASAEQFQRDYSRMIQQIKAAGFNAVFFQIRPCSDAFYNSGIHPFSRFIRGTEGLGYTQFDILGYMIQETHRQGLQFHAWLNPYRIAGITRLTRTQYLNTLSPNNFARKNPDAVLAIPIAGGTTLLLNPGLPQVRQHLLATVREIIQKYHPDSIHFDDYFYPYNYQGKEDYSTYRKFNRDPGVSIEEWRRRNVTQMVREVSALIRSNNRMQRKNIRFGISPFGIWRNRASSALGSPTRGNESYQSNYSNTWTWVRNNWIDYIIPQLYWKFAHPKAPYACLADWWADTVSGTNVKLYIGHGAHLTFSAGDADELKNQLLFNSRRVQISGSVFYSYSRIFHPDSLLRRSVAERVIYDCWRGTLPPLPKKGTVR